MNETKRYIVDATIAVKWVLEDEPDSNKTDNLMSAFLNRDCAFHAPSIFRYEVVGALKRACTSKTPKGWRIERSEARGAIEELFNLAVQIHETDVTDAKQAFDMACRFSKGYYDMLYLRLAQELNCQLITADERMVHAVPSDFPRENICLLSDWSI